mmetsp:Transcript_47699/g.124956  ORF Transcript_47699/g.124956 Transcript_47699/m.124956 type:complete len:109 (+) Transcript_47699:580-906(+)
MTIHYADILFSQPRAPNPSPQAAILADGKSVDGRMGKTCTRKAGDLAYINDSFGLHKVGNPSCARAVSLHVYAPGWIRPPLYDEMHFQEAFPKVDAGGAEFDAPWGDF